MPKVKAPRDVWFVETLLDQLETELGLDQRIGLEVLIEETEALARVEEIAASSPRLEALILGVGDLSASQGIRIGHIGDAAERYPGDMWHYARNRMIVAARANGLDAIDGPYANFRNPDGYRREAAWAATLGCVGKWAIHPSQIEIANDVFAPTEEEIATARQAVEAVRAAEQAGAGAASLGGIDDRRRDGPHLPGHARPGGADRRYSFRGGLIPLSGSNAPKRRLRRGVPSRPERPLRPRSRRGPRPRHRTQLTLSSLASAGPGPR